MIRRPPSSPLFPSPPPFRSGRPVALVARAVRGVEVRVQSPPLVVVAVTDEHEPIRLEELPQVDLRKNAGVTRVARALEAVEGKPGERVGRSDLVDDEDTAARTRDAHELGEDELRPRDVMKRPERAG